VALAVSRYSVGSMTTWEKTTNGMQADTARIKEYFRSNLMP